MPINIKKKDIFCMDGNRITTGIKKKNSELAIFSTWIRNYIFTVAFLYIGNK